MMTSPSLPRWGDKQASEPLLARSGAMIECMTYEQ